MFPTLVEIFNITSLSNIYIYNMWACKFYYTKNTIILPWYWLWLSVLSHIKYHTCQSHVKCHFVSSIGRCGCTAKCQEAGMQYHQREWTHTRWCSLSKNVEPVLQCRERLTKGSCHIWHGIHRSITNCIASQASQYSHGKHCILHWSRYLTGLEASVHSTSTAESVMMQHTVQPRSLHLVDIRILDI